MRGVPGICGVLAVLFLGACDGPKGGQAAGPAQSSTRTESAITCFGPVEGANGQPSCPPRISGELGPPGSTRASIPSAETSNPCPRLVASQHLGFLFATTILDESNIEQVVASGQVQGVHAVPQADGNAFWLCWVRNQSSDAGPSGVPARPYLAYRQGGVTKFAAASVGN